MEKLANDIRYRLLSLNFLGAYVTTMRPYLLFVSGITGAVGMSFVADISAAKAFSIFIASFLSYGFGQALTDCFQVDTDSLSSPYRPLTKGLVSKTHILVVSILGLICCVSVFAAYNPFNLFVGLASGIGLATYTPFKRRWWAGPFYNAWIVVALCVMAAGTGEGKFSGLQSFSFDLVLLTVFFGYANFVLAGYFKDIDADRQTAYYTLPVVFGRKISAIASDAFAGLTLASVGLYAAHVIDSKLDIGSLAGAGLLIFAGAFALVAAQIQLHRVRTDEDAHPAIALVVHGYILTLAGMSCLQKPDWTPFIILFYSAFVLVLKSRPAQNQI